jgi:hypothetical protein
MSAGTHASTVPNRDIARTEISDEHGQPRRPGQWSQRSRYGERDVSVYVDNAFAVGDWGRWTGGGHLQADTTDELHEFAQRLGLRREWFQCKPGRPENDHYDLGRKGRERALALGAIDEDRAAGTRRRQAIRRARRADAPVR